MIKVCGIATIVECGPRCWQDFAGVSTWLTGLRCMIRPRWEVKGLLA
jgi:hypothetical protein